MKRSPSRGPAFRARIFAARRASTRPPAPRQPRAPPRPSSASAMSDSVVEVTGAERAELARERKEAGVDRRHQRVEQPPAPLPPHPRPLVGARGHRRTHALARSGQPAPQAWLRSSPDLVIHLLVLVQPEAAQRPDTRGHSRTGRRRGRARRRPRGPPRRCAPAPPHSAPRARPRAPMSATAEGVRLAPSSTTGLRHRPRTVGSAAVGYGAGHWPPGTTSAGLALAMPEAEERVSRDNLQWRVKEKLFVWQRPLRPRISTP